ncbi:PREDICTED: C-C chemokine receptor type 6 [Nanorana parkeri]|uniref:C-C chemokine receptor type 6 n=1 Tax=Nanorana parkeri TaxID=125878 RepID=UPI000853FF6B|nr:PREDICTED: C-C chemokine receptor type 6 [Nanorana parkeri]
MTEHITTTDYSYFDGDSSSFICEMSSVKELLKICGPIALSIIFIFGFVGNILVVVTFSCYKRSKTMTDIFLLNMAIADMLFIFTLPFWAVYYQKDEWIFQGFMCKLLRSIYAINFSCSMLLLACVGIDRYVAIVQVTKSFRLRNIALSHKGVLCLTVWIVAACLSSITYIFSESYKPENSPVMVCEARFPEHLSASKWKFAIIAVEICVGFFIPFIVMLFCYACIIKTLLKAKNSQRHKAIQVIVTVVIVFLLCQVPYNLALLVKAINLVGHNEECTERKNIEYALNFTKLLAFFHCCLNPVIYAFIGVKFRNYFVKVMQNMCFMHKFALSRTRGSRVCSDTYTSRRTSEVFPSEGGSSFTV